MADWTCPKCGGSDRLAQSQCRPCKYAWAAQHREKNRERERARHAAYVEANRAEVNARARARAAADPEATRAKEAAKRARRKAALPPKPPWSCKRCGCAEQFASGGCKACQTAATMAWRLANPERSHATWRRYAAKPEVKQYHRAKQRRKYEHDPEHREKVKAYVARWKVENRERFRDLQRLAGVKRERLQRGAAFEPFGLEDLALLMGWNCYICDMPADPNAPAGSLDKAELEHVVALSRGGTHTLENLRIACRWCNSAKGARLTPEQTLQKHLARMIG